MEVLRTGGGEGMVSGRKTGKAALTGLGVRGGREEGKLGNPNEMVEWPEPVEFMLYGFVKKGYAQETELGTPTL
jgi:hypothetical protein